MIKVIAVDVRVDAEETADDGPRRVAEVSWKWNSYCREGKSSSELGAVLVDRNQ